MKTQLSNFVLGLAFLSPALSFSQEAIQPCNTYAAMEAHFAANPEARRAYEANQEKLRTEAATRANSVARTTSVQYTVPVVFHILHQGGPENITDQQCIDALAEVNRIYARESSDTGSIFAPFKSLYINSDIKMMLAHKDPNGNCTSGIIRHYDARTDWDQTPAQTQASYWAYTWEPTKYLNVYIVANIIPQGTVTSGGQIVGYTYKPGTHATSDARDAIIYRYNYLGGTQARSLAHEMGHWFNLDHTFGQTNNPGVSCGDDNITDTPVTKGNFSTCPASSTNTTILCSSGQSTYYQNVENIMDYSSCPKNFTSGQTNVMHTVLNSSLSGRNNIWSASNLTSTDVNGVTPCAPIADFLSTTDTYTVCSGGSLNLKDYSYNGTITTYQWAGSNGATAANAGASLTAMVFPTMGTSDVTLTVSNAQGTSFKVRTIYVLDGSAVGGLPPVESFENAGVPNHWVVSNTGGANTWERTENGAYDGAASFYIDGSGLTAGAQNYLQMPLMDLANSIDKNITFAYAYAKASSTQNDVLKIQGSKDCGGTWTDIIGLSSGQMAVGSGETDNTPFYPTPEQWKTFTISTQYPQWTQYTNLSSVLLRFNFIEGTVGGGNNIYIDAVKTITTAVGINELAKTIQLSLYPNPAAGEATIKFKLEDAATVKVNVVDICGKVVLPVIDSRLSPGQQTISINKEGKLASGIYFIDMNYNGFKISNKLIIE